MRTTDIARQHKARLTSKRRVSNAREGSPRWLSILASAIFAASAFSAPSDAFLSSPLSMGTAPSWAAETKHKLTVREDELLFDGEKWDTGGNVLPKLPDGTPPGTVPKDSGLDPDDPVWKEVVSSVVFEGGEGDVCALGLYQGQDLTPIFIASDQSASLILSPSLLSEGETWTMKSNNPNWYGSIDLVTSSELVVDSTGSNPLGAYSTSNAGSYATVNLYSGSWLTIPPEVSDKIASVKIGKLTAKYYLEGEEDHASATVDVGLNTELVVENGFEGSSSVGLLKTGEGTLKLLANGGQTKKQSSDTDKKNASNVTSFDLGSLIVDQGKFTIDSGTADVNEAEITASSIYVVSGAELDIHATKAIELTGNNVDVFDADDGSTIDLYVDENGYTSYLAKNTGAFMSLGKTTLHVETDLAPKDVASSMTVFAAKEGQISYEASEIAITDNILGKRYSIDTEASTDEQIVLALQDSDKFSSLGKTRNERSVGSYLDTVVARGEHSKEEYAFLSKLENNNDRLELASVTGELHASTMGFMYQNNLTTTQTLFEHMRNNALVAYSGDSSVDPMDYGDANARTAQSPRSYPVTNYNANPAYGQPLYYNTNQYPYSQGVVPISNTGAMENVNVPNIDYSNGAIYNGETYNASGYESPGNYNLGGWYGAPQRSTLATLRGQEAVYGDPGTLIYSAWVDFLGGKPEARAHKDELGYKGTQAGVLAGLDLFGSCDCRFGAYYGYQNNETDETPVLGRLKTQDHLLGLYHQYGDENVYTLMTARGGYDRYKTSRQAKTLDVDDLLTAKYNGFNLGATFERGVNLTSEPFTFSPYANLDYNFFFRDKFTEESSNGSEFALNVQKSQYHSLRGQLGARLALDMYPGSQQIRLVARAAYIHEFLDSMYGKTWANFASLPSTDLSYAILGNSMGRDWAMTGLDLDWAPIPALLVYVKGSYLTNKYTRTPFSSAGLKYRW